MWHQARWVCHLLALFAEVSWSAEAPNDGPTVQLEESQVTYRGIEIDSIEHFQNIKFAESPSRERRFAPPVPFYPPAESVMDATAPGFACPQGRLPYPPFYEATMKMNEDCLNLRVARPAGLEIDSTSKLPVVVFIHGGGSVKGSAYDEHFDPTKLLKASAAQEKPIIYVAFNYRLGVFGFANLPGLEEQKFLNAGMRDQLAALQWVKDNIPDFGGDADRITVFGVDTGAIFSTLQTMAYGGEQGAPFQQVWAMSGPPGMALNATTDATRLHTLAVAKKTGCGDIDDSEMLECLRKVPTAKLLDVGLTYAKVHHPPQGHFTWVPVVDGDILPDRQSKLAQEGKFAKGIRMVLGWTQDDGSANPSTPGFMLQSDKDVMEQLLIYGHALSDEQIITLMALYPAAEFIPDVLNHEAHKGEKHQAVAPNFYRLSRILRDILYTCPAIQFAHDMARHTRAAHDATFDAVRLYALNQTLHAPVWARVGIAYLGAAHGSDTAYLFAGLDPDGAADELAAADAALAARLSQSFIRFAYTGDPGAASSESSPGLADWPTAFASDGSGEANLRPGFTVELVGGPYGTGPVAVGGDADEDADANVEDAELPREGSLEDGLGQEPMVDATRFGAMQTPEESERKRLIRGQMLVQRCAFINSLAEALGR